MTPPLDEDEFADNAADESPALWIEQERRWLNADLRLNLPGRELSARQEAEYQGFDPDEFDY